MQGQISYQCFNSRSDASLMKQLIACYQEVFSDEPWNEWKKCQVCQTKWGIKQMAELEKFNYRHCDATVVDFWKSQQLKNDFQELVSQKQISFWVAMYGCELIGFIIGYPLNLKELEIKLDQPGIVKKIRKRFGKIDFVVYQADIGVKKHYRRHDIATELFKRRLADFQKIKIKIGIVRVQTNPPSVTLPWFRDKLGYEVIAQYNEPQKRVILARTLDDLEP
jgi:hypothetical protein